MPDTLGKVMQRVSMVVGNMLLAAKHVSRQGNVTGWLLTVKKPTSHNDLHVC